MDTTTLESDKVPVFLNCALSISGNEHICEEPLILSCDHFICKKCLNTTIDHNSIKCNICNQMNSRDLNEEANNVEDFNSALNNSLNTLFNVLLEKFKNSLEVFKDLRNIDERIENHVQFIKEDIQIQIESIKLKLDEIGESLEKELEEVKEKCKLEIKNVQQSFDKNLFTSELDELEDQIKKQENLTSTSLYHYQNQLIQLQNIITEYNEATPNLKFIENKNKIDKEIIGHVICDYINSGYKKMATTLKQNNYEKVNLSCKPNDFCVLPNGNLLFTYYDRSNLHLYNSDFDLIKVIAVINGRSCNIINVACDDDNNLYMSDYGKHMIIKTDLDFNQMETFGNGAGSKSDQLNCPRGLCCYNKHVYVCDWNNKRIVVLDSDLKFHAIYQLKYGRPCFIRNASNVAMIREFDESRIYFYDLDNFTLLNKYEGHNGVIGASKSLFFEYYAPNKKFYCYDKYGNFIEEIKTNGLGMTLNNYNGAICTFGSKLYVANCDNTLLIVYS